MYRVDGTLTVFGLYVNRLHTAPDFLITNPLIQRNLLQQRPFSVKGEPSSMKVRPGNYL
jgi:hypothetical protein